MCEMFGSNFFILAVTQICDRKWENKLIEKFRQDILKVSDTPPPSK